MTHGALCVQWTHNLQDVIIGYRCFPSISLVENWLSIFLKNNTYSEKNWSYKYILKVNETDIRTRYELFPKSASKKTIRTMSHRRCSATVFTANFEHYSYLVFVFLVLTLTSVQQYIKLAKKICCCFIFGLKNFDSFCKFLLH